MDHIPAGDYDFRKFPWFPPFVVVRAMNLLSKICEPKYIETKREFKLAREIFEASIALLGTYEIDPINKYYLQGNFQTSSLDVLAGVLVETEGKPVNLGITQLEMVTMTENTETNDVMEFLEKTKFSKKKDYDRSTMIVCTVKKKIQINVQKIIERMQKLNPKSTVYIVGKFVGEGDKWVIFSPHPLPTPVKVYKLSEAMMKSDLPKAKIVFGRKLVKKISFEEAKQEVSTVWELFGIKESEIERYKIR